MRLSAAVDQGISEKKVCAHGVDRIGSLEMLILSEFEAFELTQGMLRMHHLATRPGIKALLRLVHGRLSSVKV